MNTERLQYFVETYRLCNMVKAAESIGISHQGLSRSIKQLESELRVSLFLRTAKGLVPTPFANDLYDQAIKMLEVEQSIKTLASHYVRQEQGVIAIGLSGDNLFSHLIEMAVNEYVREHPDVRVAVRPFNPYDPEAMLDAVMSDQLDFIWVFHRTKRKDFEYYPLHTTTLGALVGPESPFYEYESLTWDDLSETHIILPTASDAYTHIIKEYAESSGSPISEQRCVYASDAQSVAHLLYAPNIAGVAAPGYVDAFYGLNPDARLIPIKPALNLSISFLSKKNQAFTPAQKDLLNFLCKRFEGGVRGFF